MDINCRKQVCQRCKVSSSLGVEAAAAEEAAAGVASDGAAVVPFDAAGATSATVAVGLEVGSAALLAWRECGLLVDAPGAGAVVAADDDARECAADPGRDV